MTAVVYTGSAADIDAAAEHIKAASPFGFAGEPIDIANAALYLASDDARNVTGQCLVVDAGETTNAGSRHFSSVAPELIVESGRRA
jgi:NAD(P)-dependent dehydrogenase (short-subunit alcohol dehydrogenase family)